MSSRTKTLLWLGVVVMTLWTLAGAAAGNRLAFRNELTTNAWRAVWREMEYRGGSLAIRCALTLEGTFHSLTITKTRGALIGYVTGASVSACSSGGATVLTAGLPWHVQYETFTGTLPTISSVRFRIIGFEFRISEPFGITCLFRSTEARPLLMTLNREASGVLRSGTLGGTIASGEECGLEFTFGGTSTSFGTPPPPPSPSTAITLTLI